MSSKGNKKKIKFVLFLFIGLNFFLMCYEKMVTFVLLYIDFFKDLQYKIIEIK